MYYFSVVKFVVLSLCLYVSLSVYLSFICFIVLYLRDE